jgi:hypothetical protein
MKSCEALLVLAHSVIPLSLQKDECKELYEGIDGIIYPAKVWNGFSGGP